VFLVAPAPNRRRIRIWSLASAELTVEFSRKPE
jgi:hypothetical protein